MVEIDIVSYHNSMKNLLKQLKVVEKDFDCIVCIKRSGFILGAFLSNKLTKPLFTQSEIDSIPKKFKNVLLVDDKIQTGKTFNKTNNKLKAKNFKTKTATLFVEGVVFTDYFANFINSKVKLWYEN